MNRLARACFAAAVVGVLGALAPASAARAAAPPADPATAGGAGPSVTVDPPAARPGEPVAVTVSGFESMTVTVAVCGNLARRGSADCDVRSSEGLSPGLGGGEDGTRLFVTEPPVPCPCVVRAANSSHDEVATAPLEVIGVAVAPVVEPERTGPLLAVSVEVRRARSGLAGSARAALGGPTTYEVAVSVRNRTDETLDAVRVAGVSAHRFDDDAASFEVTPGPLGPRQTWRRSVEVEVPAPAIGDLRWEVVASGAGPAVRAERTTTATPVLLLALLAVLAVDLAAMSWRATTRRRGGRRAGGRHRPGAPPARRWHQPRAGVDDTLGDVAGTVTVVASS